MENLEWQTVKVDRELLSGAGQIHRARVPGGWLVRWSSSIAFVPDAGPSRTIAFLLFSIWVAVMTLVVTR